ncbi:MAG TPA: acetyl-CoA hydrolase/transferase C-terminal domain-containing protein [Kouleothrix sp.]|nr:acetyl-CoA hydrolase/transferase C-terminal domain-containing protein [Kouleothrix sp.]HRC74319.1 acetyl-CoA hydrolase/transferase C-terminal domain-containing protein [Kouleothrix sp.]
MGLIPRPFPATARATSGWQQHYYERRTDAEQAIRAISSGERVFMAGMGSVPKVLVQALVARVPELHDVELVQVLSFGAQDLVAPGMEQHLRVNALFISPGFRPAVNEGRADFTPIRLSEIPNLCRRHLKPDTALIQLSPPDEDGFCSFGIEVGITRPAALSAKRIIAEINPHMPRTLGDSFIHVTQLDRIVEVDYLPPEVPMANDDPTDQEIGRHVAGLVEDGATLQMGIGAIPDGVLRCLRDGGARDLGVHTEMFADGVIDLVERGVITNARKTIHRGKIVAAFLLGSRRLYSFVDNNRLVEMHAVDYTNDPYVIAQNTRMTAINSAIEVDLTGQVCADSIGHQFYSGVGGQLDFIRGAARSPGGKPIIALPSTAQRDAVSRVVDTLKPGAGVVTTRNDVHFVVTEYGVADLYGKTIRQRAQAMIDIAHPKFRETLTARARELRLL